MLNHECRGTGPAVVFIAGLGGLGAFWKPVMDRLEDAFTVITLDHPGSGKSPRTGPQTIPGLVDAVLELTGSLRIDRFSVVGHSTGGLVAQALALDHPQVLDKLVLSCAWAQPDRRFRDLFLLRREILMCAGLAVYKAHGTLLAYPPEDYERFAPASPVFAMPTTHAAAHGMTPGNDATGICRTDIDRTTIDSAEIAITAERIDMLLGYSRVAELSRITTPTLVMAAMDDQIVPHHHAEQLARAITGAHLWLLDGGHFPPVTQTDIYTAQLRAFLLSSSKATPC